MSDECDVWKGATFPDGRGRVRLGSRVVTTDMVAFVKAYGMPDPGAVIFHTCGNNSCNNPAHLTDTAPAPKKKKAKKKAITIEEPTEVFEPEGE